MFHHIFFCLFLPLQLMTGSQVAIMSTHYIKYMLQGWSDASVRQVLDMHTAFGGYHCSQTGRVSLHCSCRLDGFFGGVNLNCVASFIDVPFLLITQQTHFTASSGREGLSCTSVALATLSERRGWLCDRFWHRTAVGVTLYSVWCWFLFLALDKFPVPSLFS